MKRFIAGFILSLVLLAGCAKAPVVLLDTQTVKVTRDGNSIVLYHDGDSYPVTLHRVKLRNGERPAVKTIVDSDSLLVQGRGSVLTITDRASGTVYVISL